MFNQKLQVMESGASKKGPAPKAPEDLRRLPLLANLTDDELAKLHAECEIHHLRPRQAVSYIQYTKDRAGFVWSGRARVAAFTPTGSAVTVGEVQTGGAFGFAFAIMGYEPHESLRIVADEPTTLVFFQAQRLVELMQANFDYAKELIRHFALHSGRVSSRLFELTAFDVRTRLQAEILRLCAGAGDARSFVISPAPTQARLAAQISATREAVTRHLKELEDDGLIEFRRGVILVTSLPKLRAATPSPAGEHLFRPRSDGGGA